MFPRGQAQSYHTINQTYSLGTKKTKTCSVIKISFPADVHITRKTNEKLQKYAENYK